MAPRFASPPQPLSAAQIIAYYDECWSERMLRGHNAESLAIHFGLYDTQELSAEAAKARLNDALLEALDHDDGPCRLLDLGCGVGGTAFHLARHKQAWSFVGANVSPHQVAHAQKLARERELSARTQFVLTDYHDFADITPTFDAAYAIESLCHATARPVVLRNVATVLRQGAPFVVIDFFRTERNLPDATSQAQYEAVKAGFCIHDYYDAGLPDALLAAGFVDVSTSNATDAVLPGVQRSARTAKEALSTGVASDRWKAHFKTCAALEPLLKTRLLEYRIVRAVVGPSARMQ
jgi:ubiquinone/menaquinone biosynthesis C-methylase UbiE